LLDWPTNCRPIPSAPRPAKPIGIETIRAVRATVDCGISLPCLLASGDISVIVKEIAVARHVKIHTHAQPQRG
jgi:hypothetical protein